jgi:hypothetical protein
MAAKRFVDGDEYELDEPRRRTTADDPEAPIPSPTMRMPDDEREPAPDGRDRADAGEVPQPETPTPTSTPPPGPGIGAPAPIPGPSYTPQYQQAPQIIYQQAPAYNGPDFSAMFASQQADKAARDAKASQLFDFLMGKAKQAEAVDPNDPVIRQQADTYSARLTRQGRNYLSELAERKGAGGNIGAESRMMAEKNAQAGAEYEGGLYQHELDSRRTEIMQALSQASEFMTGQQQMALQEELATIDQMQKKYQTDLQESQFSRNLQANESQFGRNLNQNESQYARGLNQREQEFVRGLGASSAQAGAALGQRASEFDRNLAQRAYEYDTDDEYRRVYGGA